MSTAVNRRVPRAGWLTVLLCVSVAVGAAARGDTLESGTALRIVAGADGSVGDVTLLRAAATELESRSPTFRQMLVTVQDAEHLVVIVRPLGSTRDLGEGRFVVQNGVTTGLLVIGAHRENPTLRIRALAHELGHATEVACLPRQAHTEELRAMLASRAGRNGWRGPIETPFADDMERTVLREFARNSSHSALTGRLGQLAADHGLPRCAGPGPEAVWCLFGSHTPGVNTQQRGAEI